MDVQWLTYGPRVFQWRVWLCVKIVVREQEDKRLPTSSQSSLPVRQLMHVLAI